MACWDVTQRTGNDREREKDRDKEKDREREKEKEKAVEKCVPDKTDKIELSKPVFFLFP